MKDAPEFISQKNSIVQDFIDQNRYYTNKSLKEEIGQLVAEYIHGHTVLFGRGKQRRLYQSLTVNADLREGSNYSPPEFLYQRPIDLERRIRDLHKEPGIAALEGRMANLRENSSEYNSLVREHWDLFSKRKRAVLGPFADAYATSFRIADSDGYEERRMSRLEIESGGEFRVRNPDYRPTSGPTIIPRDEAYKQGKFREYFWNLMDRQNNAVGETPLWTIPRTIMDVVTGGHEFLLVFVNEHQLLDRAIVERNGRRQNYYLAKKIAKFIENLKAENRFVYAKYTTLAHMAMQIRVEEGETPEMALVRQNQLAQLVLDQVAENYGEGFSIKNYTAAESFPLSDYMVKTILGQEGWVL